MSITVLTLSRVARAPRWALKLETTHKRGSRFQRLGLPAQVCPLQLLRQLHHQLPSLLPPLHHSHLLQHLQAVHLHQVLVDPIPLDPLGPDKLLELRVLVQAPGRSPELRVPRSPGGLALMHPAPGMGGRIMAAGHAQMHPGHVMGGLTDHAPTHPDHAMGTLMSRTSPDKEEALMPRTSLGTEEAAMLPLRPLTSQVPPRRGVTHLLTVNTS